MCKFCDESKNNQRMSKVAQDVTYEEKNLEAKRGLFKKGKKAADIFNKFYHGREARKRSNPFPSFCLLFFFLKNALSKKRQLLSTLGLKKEAFFWCAHSFVFSKISFFKPQKIASQTKSIQI